MRIRLPKILATGDDAGAVGVLHAYFRRPWITRGRLRSGALWDGWDSTGTRAADTDVFTADDLVAVACLDVAVSPDGADVLLRERCDEFTAPNRPSRPRPTSPAGRRPHPVPPSRRSP